MCTFLDSNNDDWVRSLFDSWMDDIEFQQDNTYQFCPTLLPDFYQIDNIFDCLCRDPQSFADIVRRPFERYGGFPNMFKSYGEDLWAFGVYFEYLSLIFYLWAVRLSGRKTAKLKNLDKAESRYNDLPQLILGCKKFYLPNEAIEFIRSLLLYCIQENELIGGNTYLILCQMFVSANDDDSENQFFIEKLRVDANDRVMCYRLNYHRTHSLMDWNIFLEKYLPLYFIDYVKIPENFNLPDKLPNIIAWQISKESPFKYEVFEKLFCEDIKCVNILLCSDSPQDIRRQTQLFELLYNKVMETDEIEKVTIYGMLLVFNSLALTKKKIISQKQIWKENVIQRCEKFLSSLRSIDNTILPPEEYRHIILCSYQAALFLRDITNSIWRAMKPLYLAIRKTRKIWVNSTLWVPYFHHDNLVSNLIFIFASHRDEYAYDNELKSLRQCMADYFSDLLKPLPLSKRNPERINFYSEKEIDQPGFDINCVEPDPVWRYCIIRAMVDLGVSVDGKGHFFFSVLKNVAEQDKASEVRDAAKKAMAKMETFRNGCLEGDHHRHLFMALWWIRLAHAKTLDAPLDLDKAKKLRVTECRNIVEGDEDIDIDNTILSSILTV